MSEGEPLDFLVIGSGFGGSAAALRLSEKGYDVRVVEMGHDFKPTDFPRSNWNVKRWLWAPRLGFRGLFRMTFFRHVTVLSGVGVGGGSLVYASTHPVPGPAFFREGSWAGTVDDWAEELAPWYATAKRMLGVTRVPFTTPTDKVLRDIADARGLAHHPTDVAIYFGTPGATVADPFFGGIGPDRTGCNSCGACMLGCPNNAKNTLPHNYLHFARAHGAQIDADTEVTHVRPLPEGGYEVTALHGARRWFRRRVIYRARNVVFAGGVLGTVDLLLRLKDRPDGLPNLSARVGHDVRTNSEALIGVISQRRDDLSKGVAIGSILELDERAHVEPTRFPSGSGLFRLLIAPHVHGETFVVRMARFAGAVVRHPLRWLRAWLVPDLARYSTILLYMRTGDGTLALRRGALGMGTHLQDGAAPTASIPEATAVAQDVATRLDGVAGSLVTETALNIPTTAHILGGCVIGADAQRGAIDAQQRLFGYEGLYVMDGSTISANPGVNPSLTILAMAERALSKIPAKPGSAAATSPRHIGYTAGTPAPWTP